MKARFCFLMATSLLMPSCKSTPDDISNTESAIDSTSSRLTLKDDISSQTIAEHERIIKRSMPSMDHHIDIYGALNQPDSSLMKGPAVDSECFELAAIVKIGSDPKGIQNRYADMLGFESCRAAPTKIGLAENTCRKGFNCQSGKNQSAKGVYFNLVYPIDLTSDPQGNPSVCRDAIAKLKTVNNRPVRLVEDVGYATFDGRTSAGADSHGCHYVLIYK